MTNSSKRVLYAGSFDPPTWGHMDIVSRAAHTFEGVVVLVAENTTKKGLFSLDERLSMLRHEFSGLKNVKVDSWGGLLVDYGKKHDIQTFIRGIRTISDYEYEASMSRLNSELNESIDTVFFYGQKGLYSFAIRGGKRNCSVWGRFIQNGSGKSCKGFTTSFSKIIRR